MIASIVINIRFIIIIINKTIPIAPDIIGTVLEPLAVVDTVVDETGVLILVVPSIVENTMTIIILINIKALNITYWK